MPIFYFNAMVVAGDKDDIDAFLDDVGIPRDLVGHNHGTDCDVYEGENKRLNDERFTRFDMTAKEAAGIHVDRVRTEYRNDGVWIGFDSWGWHATPLTLFCLCTFNLHCELDLGTICFAKDRRTG
jgi:hypothetical protein